MIDSQLDPLDRRFRVLTEHAPVGIFLADASGDCKFVNRRWQEMAGLTDEEARGTGWIRAIHPDDRERLIQEWDTAANAGHEFASEYRFRSAAGRVTWLQGRAVPLRDQQGRVTEYLGSCTDITDRRQAEIALRESEERFRRVQEASPEGFALLQVIRDPAGRVEDLLITYVNHAATRITGHDLDGRRAMELYPDLTESRIWETYLRVANGGPSEVIEYPYREDTLAWYRALVVNVGRDELAVMFSNVTSRVESAVAERQARDDAEQMALRLVRLQTVTAELARAVTPERIAEVVANHGVAAIDAKMGAVYLVEPEGAHARILRVLHYHEEDYSLFSRVPLDGVTPLADVIRTGEPVILETREDLARRYPILEAHMHDLTIAVGATVTLPLLVDQEPIGALVFAFEGARRVERYERTLGELLARHCAQAFERVRLLEVEKTARRQVEEAAKRLEILAEASRAFSAAQQDLSSLFDVIADHVRTGIGDTCLIMLTSDDGQTLVPAAFVARDPEVAESGAAALRVAPIRIGQTLIGKVAQTGEPIRMSTIEPDVLFEGMQPEQIAHLERFPICSAMTVPIRARGAVLGVVGIRRSTPGRPYTEQDQALLQDLADRAGLAIGQARAYDAERTARGRAEEAARQADEASRLKEEFLATVSHELRTPLSAILGWATLLKSTLEFDPAAISKGLEVIERNARSQLRIIEDILDVSRIIRGEIRIETEPVDLDRIGREVLESVRPSATAKDIELIYESSDEPRRIVGDSERMRQILWNLLSNAVKFTKSGGMVWLSIAPVGGKMVLSVRDTGRGIDPAFVPHVFERFRQADGSTTRSSGGLGLGLAIVRHLAEMHGGTVTAASEGLGKGATFTVTLPVKAFSAPVGLASSATAGPTPAATAALRRQGVLAGTRVLVVEDEDDARELIEILLSGAGAVVKTTSSAEDAMGELTDFDPQVLVSDIGMPGRDGYWLVEAVRKQRPGLPTVALTAFSRGEDERRARTAGFDHHLGKPVDPERLLEIVASYRSGA